MKNLIFLFLFATVNHISIAEVTGHAFLEEQTDHSGIKIKFIPNSPTAVLDSTYSIEDGSYSIILEAGVYFVTFSKSGYQTIQYNDGNPVVITANYILSDVTLLEGVNIVYLSGNISGVLTSELVYIVTDDITIPVYQMLSIEPGTLIKLQSGCNFNVHGVLEAIGTEEEKIVFTSAENPPSIGDWGVIYFYGDAYDTCFLKHCKIEYGNMVYIESLVTIDSSELCYLYIPINCYSCNNSHFINNILHDFSSVGINVDYTNSLSIGNNIIALNAQPPSGVFCGIQSSNSDGIIEGNYIYCINNQVAQWNEGIYASSSSWQIYNNIVDHCKYGFYGGSDHYYIGNNIFSNNSIAGIHANGSNYNECIIQSNIIYGNEVGFASSTGVDQIDFSYNNVWGNILNYNSQIPGIGQIISTNNNGDPCDPYFNISLDPLFVDTAGNNFHVYDSSPVIDAGDNDNVISQYDLDGNPRILDGNGDGNAIVDMGIYESLITSFPSSSFICPGIVCMNENANIQYIGTASPDAIYNWDFNDGIIVSGTGPGPYQVYWTQAGEKFVSLYIIEGEQFSDTTYHYIEILQSPEMAGTPQGPTELCLGTQNVEYSTSGALYATSYHWNVDPIEAVSNISGTSTTAIIDWNPNYSGFANITVFGINECPYGIVSESLQVNLQQITISVTIISSANPSCTGEDVTFTAFPVNGGETPTYQWKLNTQNVGTNSPVYTNSELQDGDMVYCLLNSSLECSIPGWALSNVVQMAVFPYPQVAIEASPNDTVCANETMTLDAGNSGNSYLWSTGQTSNYIVVLNPAGGEQTYWVQVTNGEICSGYDTISVYFDPCTGLSEINPESKIKIFPNPAADILNIELTGINSEVLLSVLSPDGKLIQKQKALPVNHTIQSQLNLSELQKGIYLLKVENNDFVEVHKFIRGSVQ